LGVHHDVTEVATDAAARLVFNLTSDDDAILDINESEKSCVSNTRNITERHVVDLEGELASLKRASHVCGTYIPRNTSILMCKELSIRKCG